MRTTTRVAVALSLALAPTAQAWAAPAHPYTASLGHARLAQLARVSGPTGLYGIADTAAGMELRLSGTSFASGQTGLAVLDAPSGATVASVDRVDLAVCSGTGTRMAAFAALGGGASFLYRAQSPASGAVSCSPTVSGSAAGSAASVSFGLQPLASGSGARPAGGRLLRVVDADLTLDDETAPSLAATATVAAGSTAATVTATLADGQSGPAQVVAQAAGDLQRTLVPAAAIDHTRLVGQESGGATSRSGSAAIVLHPDPVTGETSVTVTATDVAGNAVTRVVPVRVVLTPQLRTAPVLAGLAQADQTVTVSSGEWTMAPTAYDVTWWRLPGDGGAVAVGTGTSLVVPRAAVGGRLYATVVARNAAGASAPARVDLAAAVAPAPIRALDPPALVLGASGPAVRSGDVLAVAGDTYDGGGDPAGTVRQVSWLRCDDAVARCSEVATGDAYRVVGADVGRVLRATVTARNASGSVAATTAATPVVALGAPQLVAAPQVAPAAPHAGDRLALAPGAYETWGAAATTTATLERCAAAAVPASCAAVPVPAGGYVVAAADGGAVLRLAVRVETAGGVLDVASAVTAPVDPRPREAPRAPAAARDLPTLAGEPQEGRELAATPGVFGGTAPFAYRFAWERCDALGGACVRLPDGALAGRHLLGAADVGHRLRALVTATNGAGAAIARTPLTEIVRARLACPAGTSAAGAACVAPVPPLAGPWRAGPVGPGVGVLAGPHGELVVLRVRVTRYELRGGQSTTVRGQITAPPALRPRRLLVQLVPAVRSRRTRTVAVAVRPDGRFARTLRPGENAVIVVRASGAPLAGLRVEAGRIGVHAAIARLRVASRPDGAGLVRDLVLLGRAVPFVAGAVYGVEVRLPGGRPQPLAGCHAAARRGRLVLRCGGRGVSRRLQLRVVYRPAAVGRALAPLVAGASRWLRAG